MVSTRSASAAVTPLVAGSKIKSDSPPPYDSLTPAPVTKPRSLKPVNKTSRATAVRGWSHTPSPLTLLWLAVSLPLVAWDTGYVLLRPLSMPGGSLHWPVWHLYDLYGRVDHMYGFKQWNLNNGFTGAQGTVNLTETILYLVYLGLWYRHSLPTGQKLAERVVTGRVGGLAILLGFSAAVMTVSKTVVYWLTEYYSGFDNIGHNDLQTLILLWIIPNGLWLIFPSYMIYELGAEIVDGLDKASFATNHAIKSE